MSSDAKKFEEIEIEGVKVTHVATKADLDECLDSHDGTKIILYQVNSDLQLLFGIKQETDEIFSHDFKYGRGVHNYGVDKRPTMVDIGLTERTNSQLSWSKYNPPVGGFGVDQRKLALNDAVVMLARKVGLQPTLAQKSKVEVNSNDDLSLSALRKRP